MTPPVGQVLQEARTRRGIDLVEAERVTKIRLKFLRAMEEDHWEELPEPVYARSFLSTYAAYLGLDDGPLLDQYERIAKDEPPAAVPVGAIRAGGAKPPRRPVKSVPFAVGCLVAIVAVGVVLVSSIGGSGGGGGDAKDRKSRTGESSTTATAGPSTVSSEVALEIRSTADVWVCLVNAGRRALVAETLPAGERRGPYESRSFEVTFGNGSVELSVDGQAARVPALAEPLGYRITPEGIRRLDPASRPTCT
jgi:cytoskeletal protein RodZ